MLREKSAAKKVGPTQRQLRVGEEVRHVLSRMLAQQEVPSELLQKHSVTIAEVRVSPDLRHAKAYVMPLGGEHLAPLIAELNEFSWAFNKAIARDLKTKTTPKIVFRVDESFDEASRIESLLNDPRVKRDIDA